MGNSAGKKSKSIQNIDEPSENAQAIARAVVDRSQPKDLENDILVNLDAEESIPSKVELLEASKVEKSIKLSMQMKRKLVQASSFAEQTFPMLVSLKVENIKTKIKAPLDVVCVIDRSDSMKKEKMDLVKDTFGFILKYMGDNDRLSIVTFNHDPSVLLPLVRTSKKNKKSILEKVKSIKATGGTDIEAAMKCTFEILTRRKEKNAVTSILLLSDGRDGGAQFQVKKHIEKMKIDDSITIHSFGFGNDHDPRLMNDIAAFRDGNFYFIKQLDTVNKAFVDCLGGLLSTVGQNVEIRIKPEDSEELTGVKIVKAYGDGGMWNQEENTYTTKLAGLITGAQKDFVLELTLPQNKSEFKGKKDVKVASAEAIFKTLDGHAIIAKADLMVNLIGEEEEMKNQEEDNKEVMINFFRVKGALVIEESVKHADKEEFEEAQKILNDFKEELENSFLKKEEFIQNLIKDIEQAIQNVDPEVYTKFGMHEMIETTRTQMHQKSNLKSKNNYQNEVQVVMMQAMTTLKPGEV